MAAGDGGWSREGGGVRRIAVHAAVWGAGRVVGV